MQINEKIPYIENPNKNHSNEIITELNKDTMEIIKECCNRYKGTRNNEVTIAKLQAEIDALCGGERLFEVRKKYNKYKRKAKLYDTGEIVEIEEEILDPHSLDVVWVGDIDENMIEGEFYKL